MISTYPRNIQTNYSLTLGSKATTLELLRILIRGSEASSGSSLGVSGVNEMDDISIKVSVLTTKNATDRHADISSVIESSGCLKQTEWSLFYAVSEVEAGLTYDDRIAVQRRGRTLSVAEVSCFASHFAMATEFLDSQADYLIVFEDDVFIDPYFDFEETARLMAATEINYLRLYGRALVPPKLLVYWERFQLVRFPWTPGGTQAYIYSRKGAQNFVDHARKLPCIFRPIDVEMDLYRETGNLIYGFHPWPVLEKNLVSTIHRKDQQDMRDQKRDEVLRTLPAKSRLTKFSQKLEKKFDNFQKRVFDRSLKKSDQEVGKKARHFLERYCKNKFHLNNQS